MMNNYLILTLFIVLMGCSGSQNTDLAEAPTGDNAPHWFGLETTEYDALPTEAFLDKIPWPGDYWATTRGGISFRWQTGDSSTNYQKHLYEIPDETVTTAYTDMTVNLLSPAEKYDLWQGRKNLNAKGTATRTQRDFMIAAAANNQVLSGDDAIPSWTGICNGWSLAAIFEEQPQEPVTVQSPGGLDITFYAGDLKALMSQIYFDYQPKITVNRLGSMCSQQSIDEDDEGRPTDLACRDVNPMSFHLALGGYLAKNKAFVYDTEGRKEVWNQPVYGYDDLVFENLRPIDADYKNAAEKTVSLVDVSVDLHYIVESHPELEAMSEDKVKRHIKSKTYSYTLELDKDNKIVGGEWDEKSEVPDFLWKPNQKPSDRLLGKDYPISYDAVKGLFDSSVK